MAKKIVSTAKIEKCEIGSECAKMKFDGFDFTVDQYKHIADLVKQKTTVQITIEPLQGEMFGEDN